MRPSSDAVDRKQQCCPSHANHRIAHASQNFRRYVTLLTGIISGGTDGFDVYGNNNYIHDVSVENGDECVCARLSQSHCYS